MPYELSSPLHFFPSFPHSIRPNGWQPQPRSCSSFKASRLSQSWLVSVPPMLLIAVLLEPRRHRKCISHKLSTCKKNTLKFMHMQFYGLGAPATRTVDITLADTPHPTCPTLPPFSRASGAHIFVTRFFRRCVKECHQSIHKITRSWKRWLSLPTPPILDSCDRATSFQMALVGCSREATVSTD